MTLTTLSPSASNIMRLPQGARQGGQRLGLHRVPQVRPIRSRRAMPRIKLYQHDDEALRAGRERRTTSTTCTGWPRPRRRRGPEEGRQEPDARRARQGRRRAMNLYRRTRSCSRGSPEDRPLRPLPIEQMLLQRWQKGSWKSFGGIWGCRAASIGPFPARAGIPWTLRGPAPSGPSLVLEPGGPRRGRTSARASSASSPASCPRAGQRPVSLDSDVVARLDVRARVGTSARSSRRQSPLLGSPPARSPHRDAVPAVRGDVRRLTRPPRRVLGRHEHSSLAPAVGHAPGTKTENGVPGELVQDIEPPVRRPVPAVEPPGAATVERVGGIGRRRSAVTSSRWKGSPVDGAPRREGARPRSASTASSNASAPAPTAKERPAGSVSSRGAPRPQRRSAGLPVGGLSRGCAGERVGVEEESVRRVRAPVLRPTRSCTCPAAASHESHR